MHTPIHLNTNMSESYRFTQAIVSDEKSKRKRTPKATPAAAWYFGLFQLWAAEVHEPLRHVDGDDKRDALIGIFLTRYLQNPEPHLAIQIQSMFRI